MSTGEMRSVLRYRQTIDRIEPYVPGKAIDEVRREFGLNDVVKLASNENPLGPSPLAVAALQRAVLDVHFYPDGGCVHLRETLAQRLAVQPDMITIGNGSDEVIKLLAEAFIEPGDEVIFADVTFSEYAYACRLMGGREVRVPLVNDTHDLDGFIEKIGPATKLVFVCNPNNPTGTYVNHEDVVQFLAKVPPNVIVVFDEAYREYVSAEDFPDTLSIVRSGANVVVLRTFSKIYGLAGLRVGYGIGPTWIMERLQRVREPFNVNVLAQVAAVAALNDQEHLVKSLNNNRVGISQLCEAFTGLGWKVIPSQANFLWVDTGSDSQRLFEGLLRQGVIVRPGGAFGCPSKLRVTVGTPEQNERLIEAILRLGIS